MDSPSPDSESPPPPSPATWRDLTRVEATGLARRYSNRANPDDPPAGASLTGTLGPLYVEAFASDVLGARLMGAQAEVDLQHRFTGPPRQRGRYTLGLSAVHDWGRAGGASPPVTRAHLNGTAVVVRPGAFASLGPGVDHAR